MGSEMCIRDSRCSSHLTCKAGRVKCEREAPLVGDGAAEAAEAAKGLLPRVFVPVKGILPGQKVLVFVQLGEQSCGGSLPARTPEAAVNAERGVRIQPRESHHEKECDENGGQEHPPPPPAGPSRR